MTNDPIPLSGRQAGAVVAILAASSLALTLGFACALPLAAFATISALVFKPRAAVGAVLAVWLINQIIGFAFLHYPTDASTIAWGLALCAIGLLSLGAALLALRLLGGFAGIIAGFLAAFIIYEGAIFLACVASGTGLGSFSAPIMTRIFVINAVAFAALLAARELLARMGLGGRADASAALRHA